MSMNNTGLASERKEILKRCCENCPSSKVCSNPSKYIIWDGVHYTEAAYKLIAKGLVEGQFSHPPLKRAPFKIA